MAELTSQERLQPALLDRLTDDDPEQRQESRERRVISGRRLRELVLRDLGWLLNTCHLEAVEDLDATPHAARSVINYGVPDLTGQTISSMDIVVLERLLRQAIGDFEPRILRDSIRVRVVRDDQQMNRNALMFEIEGELWAQPVPLRLFLKTEVDLETGDITIKDATGRG